MCMANIKQIFSDIAEAIRAKTNKTDTMKPEEMSGEINGIETASAPELVRITFLEEVTNNDYQAYYRYVTYENGEIVNKTAVIGGQGSDQTIYPLKNSLVLIDQFEPRFVDAREDMNVTLVHGGIDDYITINFTNNYQGSVYVYYHDQNRQYQTKTIATGVTEQLLVAPYSIMVVSGGTFLYGYEDNTVDLVPGYQWRMLTFYGNTGSGLYISADN